jgi:hypothetical protein
MLSPAGAKALLLYLITMTLLVRDPESNVPEVATELPVGRDQRYPVAAALLAVPTGSAGAV